ncbi:MAG: hypothetical protein Q9212_003214 [Teloschistes hypoglaucus]
MLDEDGFWVIDGKAIAPRHLNQEDYSKWAAAMNASDSQPNTPPPTPPPVPHSRLHETEFGRQNTYSWVLPPPPKPKTVFRKATDPQYFVTYLPERPDIAPKKPSRPSPTTTRVTRSQANESTAFSKLDAGGKQIVEQSPPGKSKRKRDTIESDTSAPNKVRKTCEEQEPAGPAPSIPNPRKRRHDEGDEESSRKRLHLEAAPQDNPQTRPRKASRPIRTRPLHSPSRDPGMMEYLDRWTLQPGLSTCEDDWCPPREPRVKFWCYSHFHPLSAEGRRRKILYEPARYEHMIRPHRQSIPKHARPADVTNTQSAPLQNTGGPNLASTSGSAAARKAPTVRQSSSQDKSNETTAAQNTAPSIFVPFYGSRGRVKKNPMWTRGEQKNLNDTVHDEISRFCEALEIPPAVKKQVEEMMQEIKDDFVDGDRLTPERGDLAMCIVVACNKNGITRGFQEIAELVGVPHSEFYESVWDRFTKPRRTECFWRPRKLI